jgi:NAD+ kinase
MKPLNNFIIYTNIVKDSELEYSRRLRDYISAKAGTVTLISGEEDYPEDAAPDCVIVLGGDGTMLRAAHTIGNSHVCMVGVNLGTLGFLTEVDIYHMEKMVDRLMAGDYTTEERMMLEGRVVSRRHTGIISRSLNDIVIVRSGILRLIALRVSVNGQYLNTYEADGLIVATPTGSTGYNLSAGGPVVSPNTRLILLTPICPHSMSQKSVVLDPQDRLELEVIEKRKTQENEAIVSFDGYENYNLSVGDRVEVQAAERSIRMVKMYDVNFYEVLRNKIGGQS